MSETDCFLYVPGITFNLSDTQTKKYLIEVRRKQGISRCVKDMIKSIKEQIKEHNLPSR